MSCRGFNEGAAFVVALLLRALLAVAETEPGKSHARSADWVWLRGSLKVCRSDQIHSRMDKQPKPTTRDSEVLIKQPELRRPYEVSYEFRGFVENYFEAISAN